MALHVGMEHERNHTHTHALTQTRAGGRPTLHGRLRTTTYTRGRECSDLTQQKASADRASVANCDRRKVAQVVFSEGHSLLLIE